MRQRWLPVLVSLALTCTACTQRNGDRNRDALDDLQARVDRAVFEIAPALAVMGAEVMQSKDSACKMAQLLTQKPAPAPPEQNGYVEEVVKDVLSGREDKILCAALTLLDANRAAVFSVIKDTGSVPAGVYQLSLFEPVREGSEGKEMQYREQPVGPVQSLDECRAIERVLARGAIGFRGCRQWRP